MAVTDITVDRGDSSVTIVFGDGERCRFDLTEMRVNCPCAGCRGAREKGEAPWPPPGSTEPIGVTDATLVGAWGLSITWSDGHSAGIYPWDAMRRWRDEDHFSERT